MKRQNRRKKSVNEKSMTLKQIRKFVSTLKQWIPVKVNWTDAFSKRGWYEVEKLPTLGYEVENTGNFISYNDVYIFLSNGRCTTDGAITDVWGIPWGMITKVEKI